MYEHAVVIQVQFTHKFSPLDKPMGTRGAGTCPRGLVRVCAGPWLRFSSKSFCSCFEHEDMELQKTETVTCISTIMSVTLFCSLSTTDSHTNVMIHAGRTPYTHICTIFMNPCSFLCSPLSLKSSKLYFSQVLIA